MKTCPDCAEPIQDAARVCRYCTLRFDGSAPAAVSVATAQEEWDSVARIGLILAVFLPFVGFFMGLVLLGRRQNNAGLVVLLVSFAVFFIGYLWLASNS